MTTAQPKAPLLLGAGPGGYGVRRFALFASLRSSAHSRQLVVVPFPPRGRPQL
jgi:hypothetical protein